MLYDANLLHPISAPEEVTKIYEKLSRVVRHSIRGEELVDVSLVKQSGWVAVPAERYSHIVLMGQAQLQQTFLAHGYRDLLAVALDPMGIHSSIYVVPVTVEGIEAFNRE